MLNFNVLSAVILNKKINYINVHRSSKNPPKKQSFSVLNNSIYQQCGVWHKGSEWQLVCVLLKVSNIQTVASSFLRTS